MLGFGYKKRQYKRLERQLVKMYHDMISDRHSTKQEMYHALQEDDHQTASVCVVRLFCLYEYALMLEEIMKKNGIGFTGR